MTKEELAARLDGRQYGSEITNEECAEAKAAGLVVVFGYSDDGTEFRGAIHDEFGLASILIYEGAVFAGEGCEVECKWFLLAKRRAEDVGVVIKPVWCGPDADGFDWTYQTEIPHATFDILEDADKYCRGIVFELPR